MSNTAFALGTFAHGADPFPGIVIDEMVFDTSRALSEHPSTSAMLEDWDVAFGLLSEFANAPTGTGLPVTALSVRPPVSHPGQVFAAGANYREHVIQMAVAHGLGRAGATADELAVEAGREIDERQAHGSPYVWTGVSAAISGAFDDVVLPLGYDDHDWELELGVIIGRTTRNVGVDDALDHVAGYTICNDLTTRSLVKRSDIPMMGTDWLRAKNSPTFFPTGPYLVPAAFVANPLELGIRLRLNGELMQDGTTKDMIFGPAQIISYISTLTTLRPGDMVLTGSPAGNGSHYGRFLRAGDVIEGEIDGLGSQRTTCVDAAE